MIWMSWARPLLPFWRIRSDLKRLLEILQEHGRDTRLVVSNAGEITLKHECGISKEELAEATGAKLDDEKNIGGKSASGSAKIDAVIICPCSAPLLERWLQESVTTLSRGQR